MFIHTGDGKHALRPLSRYSASRSLAKISPYSDQRGVLLSRLVNGRSARVYECVLSFLAMFRMEVTEEGKK